MHAVHFWGQGGGLHVTKKERRREGKSELHALRSHDAVILQGAK